MTEPKINIGIITESEVGFDLYGDYFLKGLSNKLNGHFTAALDSGKVTLTQNNVIIASGTELSLKPRERNTASFLVHDVVIGKSFHWMKKEKQRFRGTLKLISDEGQITLINTISLEEYLSSVISSEMNPNSSIELLKAHAIISRSWLLAQLDKKKTQHKPESREKISEEEIIRWYDRDDHSKFDFCADDHCQRYQGISKVINDNAYSAVSQTWGLVLKHNNQICDTRFSKCCGGMTESFENVWESVPHEYLTSSVDYKFELDGLELDLTKETDTVKWIKISPNAYCNTKDERILSQVLVDFDRTTIDFFRWKVEYTQEELRSIIKEKSGIDFGAIVDLIPVERGNSGRIIKLKIAGTQKTITIGKELEIRKTLSKTHLYSSAFLVERKNIIDGVPQTFLFEGAGWGHGVGLCQIGAAVMSEKGHKFDEILLHYFKGAKIQKIY
jgi:stage II sporulation protein D